MSIGHALISRALYVGRGFRQGIDVCHPVRTVGLLGGILTYAVEAGTIETNPAHGIRKPKDRVRDRRLTEAEYRALGAILRKAAD